MPQQTGYGADIHALGDQQAGVCVPQTVHIQILRQPVLAAIFLNRKVKLVGTIG